MLNDVIRVLADIDELVAAADLLATIWGYPANQGPIEPELLRALAHSGNYVAGAFSETGELIAASAGFVGRHGDDLHLHSHISGVHPAHQGTHVGFALKQHQAEWARGRGLAYIEWTFDPLVRRNAYFNLTKLQARIVAYEANFYGSMRDSVNAGDETDRAVVRWDLATPAGGPPSSETAVVVLRSDGDGRPVVDKNDADVLRAWVPEDVVALRRDDPGAARAWRAALRDTMGAALNDGYVATGITRDGWYTLEREGAR